MIIHDTNDPVERSLFDTGSRLDFYNELLERWNSGQEVIKEINAKFATPKDKSRLAEITAAIKLLEADRDLCAGYDKAQYKLKYEIDAIPRIKLNKVEVKQEGAEIAKSGEKEDDTGEGAAAN